MKEKNEALKEKDAAMKEKDITMRAMQADTQQLRSQNSVLHQQLAAKEAEGRQQRIHIGNNDKSKTKTLHPRE